MATSSGDGLWTAEQVATFLNVSKTWVYRAGVKGLLPSLRLGGVVRFVEGEVRTLARSTSRGPFGSGNDLNGGPDRPPPYE